MSCKCQIDPMSEIEKLCEIFAGKESEENWQQREKNLTLLTIQASQNPNFTTAFKPHSNQVFQVILTLRTQLSLSGLKFIKSLLQLCDFTQLVDQSVPVLLKACALTKKIVSNEAESVLEEIIQKRLIGQSVWLIEDALGDKNHSLRTRLSKLFGSLVLVCEDHSLLQRCFVRGLGDSNQNVRSNFRDALQIYKENYPEEYDSLFASLDPQIKKQLKFSTTQSLPLLVPKRTPIKARSLQNVTDATPIRSETVEQIIHQEAVNQCLPESDIKETKEDFDAIQSTLNEKMNEPQVDETVEEIVIDDEISFPVHQPECDSPNSHTTPQKEATKTPSKPTIPAQISDSANLSTPIRRHLIFANNKLESTPQSLDSRSELLQTRNPTWQTFQHLIKHIKQSDWSLEEFTSLKTKIDLFLDSFPSTELVESALVCLKFSFPLYAKFGFQFDLQFVYKLKARYSHSMTISSCIDRLLDYVAADLDLNVISDLSKSDQSDFLLRKMQIQSSNIGDADELSSLLESLYLDTNTETRQKALNCISLFSHKDKLFQNDEIQRNKLKNHLQK